MGLVQETGGVDKNVGFYLILGKKTTLRIQTVDNVFVGCCFEFVLQPKTFSAVDHNLQRWMNC